MQRRDRLILGLIGSVFLFYPIYLEFQHKHQTDFWDREIPRIQEINPPFSPYLQNALIYSYGKADPPVVLTDPLYGVTILGHMLYRHVEYYQMKVSRDSQGNVETSYKWLEYPTHYGDTLTTESWSSGLCLTYGGYKVDVEPLKEYDFAFQITKTIEDQFFGSSSSSGFILLNDGYFYKRYFTFERDRQRWLRRYDGSRFDPEPGDVRVHFRAIVFDNITILGQIVNKSIVPYIGKENRWFKPKISALSDTYMSLDDIRKYFTDNEISNIFTAKLVSLAVFAIFYLLSDSSKSTILALQIASVCSLVRSCGNLFYWFSKPAAMVFSFAISMITAYFWYKTC